MATVISNEAVSKDFYLLKAAGQFNGRMGQFCMLRAWGEYPVLSRPISIFDCDEESISFLFKVVGQGTELLAQMCIRDRQANASVMNTFNNDIYEQRFKENITFENVTYTLNYSYDENRNRTITIYDPTKMCIRDRNNR